jgi:hypothetical protein
MGQVNHRARSETSYVDGIMCPVYEADAEAPPQLGTLPVRVETVNATIVTYLPMPPTPAYALMNAPSAPPAPRMFCVALAQAAAVILCHDRSARQTMLVRHSANLNGCLHSLVMYRNCPRGPLGDTQLVEGDH